MTASKIVAAEGRKPNEGGKAGDQRSGGGESCLIGLRLGRISVFFLFEMGRLEIHVAAFERNGGNSDWDRGWWEVGRSFRRGL